MYFVFICVFIFVFCIVGEDINVVYSIDEEILNGMYIGNVVMDFNFRFQMIESDFKILKFSFLLGESYVFMFIIDEILGNFYIVRVVDCEKLCFFIVVCKIFFEVFVKFIIRSFFIKIKFVIYIQDINDYFLVFLRSFMSLEIFEFIFIGNLFIIDGVKDVDISFNYILNFYMLE